MSKAQASLGKDVLRILPNTLKKSSHRFRKKNP